MQSMYRIFVVAAIVVTNIVAGSCSKSVNANYDTGNRGDISAKLVYIPAVDYVEEESSTNPYGTKFKSAAPTLTGVSLQGKTFSIKSVTPATNTKFYIDGATGKIYIKEGHGFKLGQKYVVSVRLTDQKTRETIDFDNAFTLGVMSFSNKILYSYDFEGESPMDNLGEYNSNISICNDPVNPSNKVLRSHLPNGEYRSEVVVGHNGIHYFYCDLDDKSHGGEIWVGFKIFRPVDDSFQGDNYYPCVFQIGPINNTGPELGGNTSAGHYQLQMGLIKDKYFWRWREHKSIYNPNEFAKNLTPINRGQWEKFVLHCVFSADDQKGLMEVWLNDVKIHDMKRLNGLPYSNTRIQFGVYMGAQNYVHTPVDCYYDDVKIGNSSSSYNDVVPKK